jgi:hypothetical protein
MLQQAHFIGRVRKDVIVIGFLTDSLFLRQLINLLPEATDLYIRGQARTSLKYNCFNVKYNMILKPCLYDIVSQ